MEKEQRVDAVKHRSGLGKPLSSKSTVIVIGGGILGLSTALTLLQSRPSIRLTLIEKESALARHQTGHNSGVIHSGLYYKPGSLKPRAIHRSGSGSACSH